MSATEGPTGARGEAARPSYPAQNRPQPRRRTPAEIEQWFVNTLARELQLKPDKIDTTAPFETLGMDSVTAVGMTGQLEDWLGLTIDPMVIYDYPTIESLSKYLSGLTQ